MACCCNCHTRKNGNPDGCEYCLVHHVIHRVGRAYAPPDDPNGEAGSPASPNVDQLRTLAERLVKEAKTEMGPLGVVIVMVGTMNGDAHVSHGGTPMLVLGLKDVCVGRIDSELKNPAPPLEP